MTKRIYTETIIEDGDDLILPFPDSLIEDCGWQVGDTLSWELKDNYVVVTKVENSNTQ